MAQPSSQSVSTTKQNMRTVLVVDSNPLDRASCKNILLMDTHNAYRVVEAATVADAERITDNICPDCVLVDNYIDSENGCELISKLRERYPFMPLIMLTGNGTEHVALSALRHGATDFLEKALMTDEALCRCINNAIEKAQLSDNLNREQHEFNHSYGLLLQQHEILRHYYHTVTHELKNPLASCREFLQILQDNLAGPITSEQSDLLKVAQNDCRRIGEVLDDLFETSGLDEGKINLDRQTHDLANLVVSAVGEYCTNYRVKDIPVELRISVCGDIRMMADEVRIRRVIAKTIAAAERNAVTVTSLRIEAPDTHDAHYANIIISYEGVENDNNKLLHFSAKRRFPNTDFVVENSADKIMLGLDILFCQKVVELHGGQYEYSRDKHLGGVFTITMPLVN